MVLRRLHPQEIVRRHSPMSDLVNLTHGLPIGRVMAVSDAADRGHRPSDLSGKISHPDAVLFQVRV